MRADYNWEEIINIIKKFSNVEDISDIIILGVDDGVRRIKIMESKDE